jgi:hypothetical protein
MDGKTFDSLLNQCGDSSPGVSLPEAETRGGMPRSVDPPRERGTGRPPVPRSLRVCGRPHRWSGADRRGTGVCGPHAPISRPLFHHQTRIGPRSAHVPRQLGSSSL